MCCGTALSRCWPTDSGIIRYDNRGVGEIVCAQTGFGLHDGVLRRRLRRGDRRRASRRAGARAGARLGIGGDVGVPVPSRRERPRRLVHLGVRPERRSPRPLHHRATAASGRIGRVGLLQCAEPAAAVLLHGFRSRYPCWRRSSMRIVPRATDPAFAHRATASPPTSCITPTPTSRCGQLPEYLPRQLLSLRWRSCPDRPLRRRARAADRQRQRPVRAALRFTTTPRIGSRGCGAATSTPATGRRCRTRRCSHSRCTSSSTTSRASRRAARLLRAQVGRPREYFGDTLVSVTGAGSGIGRETALAFAREGAEAGDQRHRRGHRQGHRRADHRPRRGRACLHP